MLYIFKCQLVTNKSANTNYSSLTIGDSVDLKTAKLVTLCREGDDDIYRVIEK